ncbi:MAG: hypothetical protein NTZ78_08990 [Candidatus Aureabacteria bacterium]|nr:hypothetical protein [Candidatus Auribacterota bacterium]
MARGRLSTLLGKATAVVGSTLLTLLLMELLIRIFGLYPCLESQEDALFEYSGVYGWQFIPNKSARYVAPGESETRVKINSAGMRDEEYSVPKPPGKRRIAVLGDSFVSNMDVESKDVFTELMKKLLPPNWQVLNFGVNGYSPAQELLLLKDKVIRYEPDIVVLLIYIRNDFDDLAGSMDWIKGYKRPKARRAEEGGIVVDLAPTSPPEPPATAGGWGSQSEEEPLSIKNLHTKFLLYHFIRDRIFYRFNVFLMPEVRLCSKHPSDETRLSYSLMEGIIKEVYNFTRKNDIELLIVTAPTIIQVYDTVYWAKMIRKYGLADEDYDLFAPNEFIQKTCEDLGIRNLDLTPLLRQRAASGEQLYYRHNQHWTREGNQRVAGIISSYLRDSKLVSPASQVSSLAGDVRK